MSKKVFIVTIKMPRNPKHNPHNKVTGECKFSPVCTDVTGEHHNILVLAEGYLKSHADHIVDVRSQVKLKYGDTTHITRIELASWL